VRAQDERFSQLAYFVVGFHRQLQPEFSQRKSLGAVRQRLHGPMHQPPHKNSAYDADGKHCQQGIAQHLAGGLAQRLVRLSERHIDVQHTQDVMARRMCVTRCVRARGFILNRIDYAQYPRIALLVNAKTVGTVQPGQWLCLRVAGIAGFGALIYVMTDLGLFTGVDDAAFLIQNPDAHHAWFGPEHANRLVHGLAVVVQHLQLRGALHGVADPLGRSQGRRLQMVPVQADVGVYHQTKDQQHCHGQQQDQLYPQVAPVKLWRPAMRRWSLGSSAHRIVIRAIPHTHRRWRNGVAGDRTLDHTASFVLWARSSFGRGARACETAFDRNPGSLRIVSLPGHHLPPLRGIPPFPSL